MGLLDVLNGMQNGPRGPSTPSAQSNSGGNPPCNIYPCKPGGPNDYVYVYTSRGNPQHWPRLLEAIGRKDLIGDPRYETQDARVATIEGLARGSELHALQRKFLEHAALQCGFCTPGLLMAAKALLDANPDPTETETRYWLAGNLCRCTGYDKIVRAVQDAATQMRAATAALELEATS